MSETRAEPGFIERVRDRTARVGIVGLGYVGLPLTAAFWDAGFATTGFDIQAATVETLNAGRSHLRTVPGDTVAAMARSGRFGATTEMAGLAEMDAVVLCVPTPLDAHREPDLGAVVETCRTVAAHARPGQLVVLESTSYPGTTREVVAPILAQSGLRVDEEVFLAYSPEREDPGNTAFTTTTTPKIVGADTETSRGMAEALYAAVVRRVVPVRDTPTAEAVKISENVFRSVNIALVNELKTIYAAMGIDIWEVQAAAATKPFGFMRFDPGPGLGGHCIPIDPFYLSWRARRENQPTRFIELAGEINSEMPNRVVQRCMTALNDVSGRALKGARVLIVGVAYKKNVNDTRESPAFPIIDALRERGADVGFHDPHVPAVPALRKHPHLGGTMCTPLTPDTAAAADLVLICTDHDAVDYELLGRHAALIVDTRNAMRRAGADTSRTVMA